MNTQQPSTRVSRSRRRALGLLGAIPLAAGGTLSVAHDAQASATSTGTGRTRPGSPPADLLPGGAYDQYVTGLAAQDMFSGTVLLAWHGHPVLVRSCHDADKAHHIPNTTDTRFPLASVTKFLTGVAVTQLAARGKIDYYATLGSYLTGFPADIADVVTVHHLLTHTSGIPDPKPTPGNPQMSRAEAFNHELALLRKEQPAFTPGTQYADTSANYFLAGAIVAAASGEDFWDYMPRHVFDPAGMTSTGFYSDQQWLTDPRIAHVYGPSVDGQRQDLTSDFNDAGNGMSGAFGVFSTAPDLLRFATAVTDGTLLPTPWEALRAAGKYPLKPDQHDSGALPGPFLLGYGSEDRITDTGQRVYGHQGETQLHVPGSSQLGGSVAMLMLYRDVGVTAIALSNYYLSGGDFLAHQDPIVAGSTS